MESVWANAAPTSTFDPQFVSCDLSDADFICIKAATNPTASDAGYHTEEYLFYGKTANSMVLQPCNFSETKSEGMAVAQRSISISDTGIDFGDGGYKVTWSDTYKKSVSNVYAIPLEIFKVKGIA